MNVRKPVVAGQFYPGTKKELERTLSGLIDKDQIKEKVLGAVSPHAGYVYSGGVAGEVFSHLKPEPLYVIIGPNHTGIGQPFSVFPRGKWGTPLGEAEVDEELAKYLVGGSSLFRPDETAHAYEHSIEVQLPFLQYIADDFKILPLCVAGTNMNDLKKAGSEIFAAISALKKDAVIIASSDMTHYESQRSAKTKDMRAISAITKMDEDDLLKTVVEMDISMCGVAPVVIAMVAAKAMGATKAELIGYKTSGEASGDYDSVVGYGGLIIK